MYNQYVKKCEDLIMIKQFVQTSLDKESEEVKSECRVRLNASDELARQHLQQVLPFWGHDENESSPRRGIF